MAPKRPAGMGWARMDAADDARERWVHAGAELVAVTEVLGEARPAYRITLSLTGGGRCSAADVLFALADFDLLEAQEDHFGQHGQARIFESPVGA